MHPFPFLQNSALWQRSLLIVIIFTWFFQGVIQIIIVFHFGWVFAAGIGLHHQFPFSGGFEGRFFGQGGFLFSFAAGLLCNELCLWECASLFLFGGLGIFMTGFFPWKSPEGLFAADSSPGFLSLCTLLMLQHAWRYNQAAHTGTALPLGSSGWFSDPAFAWSPCLISRLGARTLTQFQHGLDVLLQGVLLSELQQSRKINILSTCCGFLLFTVQTRYCHFHYFYSCHCLCHWPNQMRHQPWQHLQH